jgi:FkbM family methyltransferase
MRRELSAIRKSLRVGRKLAADYPVSTLRSAMQYKNLMDRARSDAASQVAREKSLKFLNFNISYLGDRELLVMIDEIFVNDLYRFQTPASKPVIVDCGSNIGLSVLFFKSLHPGARITAFEPSARSFDLLSRNVRENGLSGVSLQNCALVRAPTTVDFFVSDTRAASLRASVFQERGTGQRQTVAGKRLSEFIEEPVDFLKMDIEGAEEQVFADLAASGRIALIDKMVVEYHHQISRTQEGLATFLGMLEQAGFRYRIEARSDPAADPSGWQDVTIRARRGESR